MKQNTHPSESQKNFYLSSKVIMADLLLELSWCWYFCVFSTKVTSNRISPIKSQDILLKKIHFASLHFLAIKVMFLDGIFFLPLIFFKNSFNSLGLFISSSLPLHPFLCSDLTFSLTWLTKSALSTLSGRLRRGMSVWDTILRVLNIHIGHRLPWTLVHSIPFCFVCEE